MMAYDEVQNLPFYENDYAENNDVGHVAPSKMTVRDYFQINELRESMEYDYDVFGLRINYIQLQDDDGNTVTEIKKGSKYAIVSEVPHRDDVEKKINYSIDIRNNAGFAKSLGSEAILSPFGTLIIDHSDVVPNATGVYDVKVWLDDASAVKKVYDDLNDDPDGDWPEYFSRLAYVD